MAGSFSQELQELLNPLPRLADPEDDDQDEATRARVAERLPEEDEAEDGPGPGPGLLRRRGDAWVPQSEGRYRGKAVSRKQLLMDEEASGGDDDGEDDDGDDDDGEEEEAGSVEELDEESSGGEEAGDRRPPSSDDVTFPQGRLDFHKLTEGMDELGVSEEDEDSEMDDDDDDDGEDDDDDGGDDDEDDDDGEDDDGGEGAVRTFSREKLDEEVEKGKAVRNQLALWDQLLEGRIKVQKALVTANRLPQPDTFPEFQRRGGAEFAAALKTAHKALKALQRSLLGLHDQLLQQSADTRSIAAGESESEEEGEGGAAPGRRRPAAKHKLDMADYPDLAAKRFTAFRPYCDATLQRWHDKTRLSAGKMGRGFAAFERSIVRQVEQVLTDQDRLLRRTQTPRSEYRVLGKRENANAAAAANAAADGEEQPAKSNVHLKHLDEDVFDDDDFYHQLLRELIERKTSAADPNQQVAAGRQWLAIQKLRGGVRRKVDTRASKGRRVRFHVHAKLLNFMAPVVERGAMSDEARAELYRGLFGQNAAGRE